jgi:hypothetical protein
MKNILLTSLLAFLVLSAYSQNEKKTFSEQEIKKLSNDWMKATMNKDEKALNKIVAPEFKLGGTDLDKPGLAREVWMKNTMESLKIDSINYIKMQVEVIDNVAIVQSIFYWSVSFRDMPAKKDTVNLIDTWIKRDESWQVVSRLVVD